MINLRGQSSEGDQNSYFKITLSQNNQLLAFYTHCFNHSLNLSLLKVCNVLFTKSISFVSCFPIFFFVPLQKDDKLMSIIEESFLNIFEHGKK